MHLLGDQLFDGGTRRNAFEGAGLGIEPLQRAKLLVAAKLGLLHGGLQDANGFVTNLDRNGIGCRSLPPWARENRAGSEKRNGTP